MTHPSAYMCSCVYVRVVMCAQLTPPPFFKGGSIYFAPLSVYLSTNGALTRSQHLLTTEPFALLN